MKTIRTLGVLIAAGVMAVNAQGAVVDVTFDGTTTGGWGLVDLSSGFGGAASLFPVANYASSGFNGIGLDDDTPGVSYYTAPASIYGMDLTGMTLNLNYEINSSGGASNFNTASLPELYINQTAISLDILDESIIDSIQSVTIDFTDSAFAGIDLTSLTSLYIKAEWWGDDAGPESHLLSAVPEPAAAQLLFASVLGIFGFARRRFA